MKLLPIVEVFSNSLVLHTFIHSISILIIGYMLMLISSQSFINSQKQRAWIITMMSSCVLTIGSLISLHAFLTESNFDLSVHPTQFSNFDLILCVFFIAYLVVDLFVGLIHYRQHLDILSGYIHHIGYLILMVNLIHLEMTSPFCIMALLEVPTLLLSLGQIWKPLRNDFLFGVAFFATRIAYHGFMIYQFYHYFPVQSWWLVLLGIYPLHLYWFSGWIKQQRKKWEKSPQNESESTVLSETKKDN